MTSRKHEGFKVTKRYGNIDFDDDSEYSGVYARVVISVPFETLFWFQRNVSTEEVSTGLEALKKFGDEFLVEWNLEDEDGNPMPATGDGILALPDYNLATQLLTGWIEAVVTPPDPLSTKSEILDTSQELMTQALAESSLPLGN